ncbi:MAG: DUF2892 domain-containing protein [Eubacteriales bacterium]
MEKNIGRTERTIRIIIGLLILSLMFILKGGLWWIGLFGLIPLLTGIIGVCPLYALIHVNTAEK